MDSGQIERELEELETRIERLRALYEQYFMGIERIEPSIPRKDVDRRIWVMRREQIRNTGLRFKFQMLIQRYNTFQQYWGRITREIENGTYRRDVVRAAKRVGTQEALTIVGRKRAERYAMLAQQQEQQHLEQERAAKGVEAPDVDAVEEMDIDDAPTPPSRRAPPPLPARAGVAPPAAAPPRRAPPPPRGAPAPAGPPAGAPLAAAKEEPLAAAAAEPLAAAEPPAEATKKQAPLGGMRWGLGFGKPQPQPLVASASGGARAAPRAAAPAVRSRVAELAAEMRAQREQAAARAAAAAPAPAAAPAGGPGPGPAPAAAPAHPPALAPATPAPDAKRRGAAATDEPAPSRRRRSRPPQTDDTDMASGVRTQAHRRPASPPSAASDPATGMRQRATASQRQAGEELPEQRLRQIYAKYVETKRAANESTAGVTYERLAESLRTQAAKLRATNPAKSVDYDVVVKDGKTLLKPILK